MVTVVRPNNITINNATDENNYLDSRRQLPQSPFQRLQIVSITDRSAVPSNTAIFDRGMVLECPNDLAICFVLVVNNDGSPAVLAIPKAHLVLTPGRN